jgi:hypothetical protein
MDASTRTSRTSRRRPRFERIMGRQRLTRRQEPAEIAEAVS